MTAPDELAEAEAIARVIAGHEQRAVQELHAQETNAAADPGFLPALEAVRYIVGEPS